VVQWYGRQGSGEGVQAGSGGGGRQVVVVAWWWCRWQV